MSLLFQIIIIIFIILCENILRVTASWIVRIEYNVLLIILVITRTHFSVLWKSKCNQHTELNNPHNVDGNRVKGESHNILILYTFACEDFQNEESCNNGVWDKSKENNCIKSAWNIYIPWSWKVLVQVTLIIVWIWVKLYVVCRTYFICVSHYSKCK